MNINEIAVLVLVVVIFIVTCILLLTLYFSLGSIIMVAFSTAMMMYFHKDLIWRKKKE